MNFLAHLHLASLAESSLTGNLLADFVRGDPSAHWPDDIADGIRLHRRLDSLSDHLPVVKQARSLFRQHTQRVAPIALDVIWDHFLACHWSVWSPEISLTDFCQQAEKQILRWLISTPPAFQELNKVMWPQRWLEHYALPEQIEKVLDQMARRRPRLAQLSDCYQDFISHYSQLQAIFEHFYPELIQRAKEKRL